MILGTPVPPTRYKILCAHDIKEPMEAQSATQFILDHINVAPEQYRMGHTKVDICNEKPCASDITVSVLMP